MLERRPGHCSPIAETGMAPAIMTTPQTGRCGDVGGEHATERSPFCNEAVGKTYDSGEGATQHLSLSELLHANAMAGG